MLINTFEAIVQEQVKKIVDVLVVKAKECARADERLWNFKAAGRVNKTHAEAALWGMYTKHLISVMDLVENAPCQKPSKEMIDEKITESINYMILLKALLYERYWFDVAFQVSKKDR